MINNVKNTVASILNKDNRGYVTPEEFNQFAKQAQLDIFREYFTNYSKAIANQNNSRRTTTYHGSGYADIPAKMQEVIDRFVVTNVLHYNGTTAKFYMPGEDPSFPNEDKAFRIDRLTYNGVTEIEKAKRSDILYLSSSLVAPSITYPIYTLDNQGIQILPSAITANVIADYIRLPFDPKWTYTSLSGGEPLFNQSAADYQDFELPTENEVDLIIKILQYAGVSIRELDVVNAMKQEELINNQEKI